MKCPDKTVSVALIAGALGMAVSTAHAVNANPRGTGQVLLYGYYTVNAGNDTLLSIANSTAHAKAIRVRIAEGENGRDTASINIYLAPFDTWNAAITRVGGLPGLITSDNSCTLPEISTYANSQYSLGSGSLQFTDTEFSGSNADRSNDSLAVRASEGTIEMIEMGTLVDGSVSESAVVRAAAGSAGACNVLYNAWIPAGFAAAVPDVENVPIGYWDQDPDVDLENPSGGLYGTAYIVNVPAGTIFSYAATAIDGFRSDPSSTPSNPLDSVVLHTSAGSAHPILSDALTDPQLNTASVEVATTSGVVSATFPAPDQAIDAVSAVLTAGTIDAEYTTNAAIGATTNYVLSYPTRRFYTDPAVAGASAIAPFSKLFAGIQTNTATETIPYFYVDQDGNLPVVFCPQGLPSCTLPPLQSPGTSVEILNLGAGADTLLKSALAMGFGPQGSSPVTFAPAGRMQFSMDERLLQTANSNGGSAAPRSLRASEEGIQFGGLPVIGFSTLNLINANAQNGILANYSAAMPFRSITTCGFLGAVPAPDPCE